MYIMISLVTVMKVPVFVSITVLVYSNDMIFLTDFALGYYYEKLSLAFTKVHWSWAHFREEIFFSRNDVMRIIAYISRNNANFFVHIYAKVGLLGFFHLSVLFIVIDWICWICMFGFKKTPNINRHC